MGRLLISLDGCQVPLFGTAELLTLWVIEAALRTGPRYLTFCATPGHGFELRERCEDRHCEMSRAGDLVGLARPLIAPDWRRVVLKTLSEEPMGFALAERAIDAVPALEEALREIGGPLLGFLCHCGDPFHGFELRSAAHHPPRALARGRDLAAMLDHFCERLDVTAAQEGASHGS